MLIYARAKTPGQPRIYYFQCLKRLPLFQFLFFLTQAYCLYILLVLQFTSYLLFSYVLLLFFFFPSSFFFFKLELILFFICFFFFYFNFFIVFYFYYEVNFVVVRKHRKEIQLPVNVDFCRRSRYSLNVNSNSETLVKPSKQ